MAPVIRTARERAREELTLEIKREARRQLADEGAQRLSLRAVARELGMASSALYRYFPSRDDLLTALIIDAYNAVGERAETAVAECPADDPRAQWRALCHGVRAWAKDAAALAGVLTALGHTPVHGPPAGLQLDFAKDGLDSSFTLVDRDAAGRVVVAGGPWAGTAWPDGLLDAGPGRIGDIEAPIVSPLAQIEIKRMMPVWDPSRPRRAKDAADIARLEAALRGRQSSAN